MPRRVHGADGNVRGSDLFAVRDRVRDGGRAGPGHADRRGLVGAAVIERPVFRVEPDRRSGHLVETLHHENVVDVRVREENALHVESAAHDPGQDAFAFDRRIDHDCLLGVAGGEQIEIVVEGADREALDPHGQALLAVIAVIPNIGRPTMSTPLNPPCSRSE